MIKNFLILFIYPSFYMNLNIVSMLSIVFYFELIIIINLNSINLT